MRMVTLVLWLAVDLPTPRYLTREGVSYKGPLRIGGTSTLDINEWVKPLETRHRLRSISYTCETSVPCICLDHKEEPGCWLQTHHGLLLLVQRVCLLACRGCTAHARRTCVVLLLHASGIPASESQGHKLVMRQRYQVQRPGLKRGLSHCDRARVRNWSCVAQPDGAAHALLSALKQAH